MSILNSITVPGLEKLLETAPGEATAVAGVNQTLAAVIACLAAEKGKKTLLVMDNDLKAARAADDVRQLTGEGCCLPGGEIDLTRAAGSLESSWRRLEALSAVTTGKVKVLCAGAEAMAQRMGRPEPFKKLCLTLKAGDVIRPADLARKLSRMGYDRVGMVEGKGQFAQRGAILDVYPPALSQGLRLEFFDDEIDGIREFDCISQRSLGEAAEAVLTPACEALLDEEEYTEAARRMREAIGEMPGEESGDANLFDDLPPLPEDDDVEVFDTKIAPKVREKQYQAQKELEADRRMERLRSDAELLEQGLPFRRMRAWLPVLTDNTASVCDWFRPDLVLLCEPDRLRNRTEERLQGFAEDLQSAMVRQEAVSGQESLLKGWDEVRKEIGAYPQGLLTELLLGLGGIRPDNTVTVQATGLQGYGGQMKALKNDMALWREHGYRIWLLSGGSSRGKRLEESLKELDEKAVFSESEKTAKPGEAVILPITLSGGFVIAGKEDIPGTAVVSDADIWGEGYRRSKSRKHSGERISTFTDLKIGDYVVHEDHGVGIYQGITRIQSEGCWHDYLLIHYGGNDKLYVPVEQLERVQRYIGNPNQAPKLNRLGGGEWARQKGKVKESLKTLAFDLKALYAERTQNTGYAFSPDTAWQREFEDEFPWELTPDQAQSVQEIREDMESDRNMDRLLCGDVGYGKTEVSLRAAFKAITDNKQVALLAPTTILVQQHYNTIVKRFRHTGARVDFLSRFRTPAEQREVIAKLAAGDIDLIVGTHRLLGKDVKFKDLGLLIVDEEQRFGVAHKEIIKNMKRQVDVLTLSATPIPRTLHMSMTGIRDMSVLETPPEERIPVQTVVTEYNDALIRDAILREVSRGGQVYFLYNRVRSIASFYERLRQLVPEARIGVAHGQMREHQLEDVMMDFYNGNYDVLLCTTIIENGLDVPTANTLIVYDAERFGLSQLYQLRGRVGRSNRQAYAYFTVRADHMLTETAQQRLTAIREFTEFGAGFRIAMRDLEIRGAGNILGPEQHGHLATVGYDMYCKLMEETLNEVQGKRTDRELETRVDLRVDAFLPPEYVAEEKQRMEMYKRIASIVTDEDRADVTDELIDRYGELPPAAETLLDVSQLRALCNRLGVSSVSRGKEGLVMKLDERYVPDPACLLQAISETDGRLALSARAPARMILKVPEMQENDMMQEALKVARKVVKRINELEEAKREKEQADVLAACDPGADR
ncbi:MAG: transcription-repair coupling factor [Clostridia bacterium]|nr:transcription-repair coupling factor [Clostridia bacterium]